MLSWLESITKYNHRFDILGTYKLTRFLARSFLSIDLITDPEQRQLTRETVFKQCQQTAEVYAIKYAYEQPQLMDMTERLENTLIKIILAIVDTNPTLKQISLIFKDEVQLADVLQQLISSNCFKYAPKLETTKGCFIQLAKDNYVINSLVKFKFVMDHAQRTEPLIRQSLLLLKDTFIPQSVQDYLSERTNLKICFTDDCWGTNRGTCITMYYLTANNIPQNPVVVLPITAMQHSYIFNLFNTDVYDPDIIGIAQMLFNTSVEQALPERNFDFIASRGFNQSLAEDFDSIRKHLRKLQVSNTYIGDDLSVARGCDISLHMFMGRLLHSVMGFDDIKLNRAPFEEFDKKYIYETAYLYSITNMAHSRALVILNIYIRAQLEKLYPLVDSYLDYQDIAPLTKIPTGFISEDYKILMPEDLTLICQALRIFYIDYCAFPKEMSYEVLRVAFSLISYVQLSPLIYFKLIAHLLNITDITLQNILVSGAYTLKVICDSGTVQIFSQVLGAFMPISSGMSIVTNSTLDSRKWSKHLLHNLVTLGEQVQVSQENAYIDTPEIICLIFPDTLGCAYVNLKTMQADDRYLLHPLNIIIQYDEESGFFTVVTPSVYTFKLKENQQVYLLQKEGSSLANFSQTHESTSLFSKKVHNVSNIIE